MTDTWKVQDAKARFSEMLDATIERGPQIVTRRGVEEAVLVPIGQWRNLSTRPRPTLKELLLAPYARTEALVPPRRKYRHRKPPKF
jgi:prevent-host-death family protein